MNDVKKIERMWVGSRVKLNPYGLVRVVFITFWGVVVNGVNEIRTHVSWFVFCLSLFCLFDTVLECVTMCCHQQVTAKYVIIVRKVLERV